MPLIFVSFFPDIVSNKVVLFSHCPNCICRLHVHYPPHVSLSLTSGDLVLEGESARFRCAADANPGGGGGARDQLTRSWFVGGERVRGEAGEEMVLEGVDRRLNGREVACEVTNSIGRTRATKRLEVSCESADAAFGDELWKKIW